MNTHQGVWAQFPCSQVNSLNHLSYGFTMKFSHNGTRSKSIPQLILLWQVVCLVQSVDWYCDASMSSKWVWIPPTIKNLAILNDRPIVHTRDRESVSQVVEWNNSTTKVLCPNPTGVHSLVWLPQACWWDLLKVGTAVQCMAGRVWSFLIMVPGTKRFPQLILPWQVICWVQSSDWYCDASMSSSWCKTHSPLRTSLSFLIKFILQTLLRQSNRLALPTPNSIHTKKLPQMISIMLLSVPLRLLSHRVV